MATDQEIRDAGFKYIPEQQYLKYPFQLPQNQEPVTDSGIVNTNAFMNSGGGGGGSYYPGSPSDLVGNFQSIVEARQERLNNPSDTFLGFNTMKDQQLTGADAGEYIGSGMKIPQEMTMMGKVQDFVTPQSARDILESGYDKPYGSGGPGILGAILGRMDNYHNLSRPDQAFIAQNMGYTGPTVFGENTGNQDPFGLNVRSGFGNYAERVGVEAEKLGDILGKDLAEKYGATFNPETGLFENDDDEEAAAKANQMTKMLRQKFGFYTNKNLEYADLINKNAELQGQQDKDIVKDLGITADDAFSTTTQGGGGGIADAGYGPGGGLDASKMGGGSQQAKSGGQKAGGTDRTDGGWGLAKGGLVSLL
jgi:hypothetical protein|tara:strand:- start:1556 stop:2650 length:1095 start_codon:yes stop_codon:yes gene_type:complete